jgi:hypothetical protein
VLLAERSDKSAVENQQYIFLTAQVGKLEGLAREIGQVEIGGGLMERDTGHTNSLRRDFFETIVSD